jgi:hypothetical protein
MNELCNEVCPRDVDDVMHGDKSVCGEKRPAWCIAKIMHKLEAEVDESNLKGAQEKSDHLHSQECASQRALEESN